MSHIAIVNGSSKNRVRSDQGNEAHPGESKSKSLVTHIMLR